MPDPLDDSASFDDQQGTRTANEPTGAGAEGTEGTEGTEGMQGDPKSKSHEHRGGYGGEGGKPRVEPSADVPHSNR